MFQNPISYFSVSVLLILKMLSTPKPRALLAGESGELCCWFRLLAVTLSFGVPHSLVPAMC